MSLLSRFRSLLPGPIDRKAKKAAHKGPRFGRRLFSEPLEDRRLLACTAVDENWIDAGGGCQDVATGLIWSDASNGVNTQSSATNWANNLEQGGYTDWRMPTKDEMLAAAGHGAAHHLTGAGGWAWSATKQGKNYAAAVNFRTGESGVYRSTSYGAGIAVRGVAAPISRTEPSIRIYSPLLSHSESSGSFDYFQLALDTRPLSNVTIPLSSSDTSEGALSVSQVTFTPTNWNVPQWVKVSAVDDVLLDGTQSYSIVTGPALSSDPAYSGLDALDIQVASQDNERALIASKTDSSVSEAGDTGSLQVQLGAAPLSGPVYVSVIVRDPSELAVSTETLTFTASNWNTPQTVIVTGLPDGIADGNVTSGIGLQVLPDSGSSPDFLGASHYDLYFYNSDIDGAMLSTASGDANRSVPSPGLSATSTDAALESIVLEDTLAPRRRRTA